MRETLPSLIGPPKTQALDEIEREADWIEARGGEYVRTNHQGDANRLGRVISGRVIGLTFARMKPHNTTPSRSPAWSAAG